MSEAEVVYIVINLRLKITVCEAISPHMLRMSDIVTYGLLRYCTKMRFNLRVEEFVDFASPYFVVEARPRRLGPWRSGGTRTPCAAPRRAVLELCQCAPPSTPSPVPTTVAASSPQYSLTFPHHIESRLIINIERNRNVNNRTTLVVYIEQSLV